MSSPAYEEGGSGGYIKRRLFRDSARTPYERPPSAARGLRSTATVKGNDGGRWLPTFMEPVSRFIARTASRLLSSVLPRRLSAQSGVEEKHLVKLDTPVVVLAEQKLADCHSLITSNAGGISDIEQFISQRWFTRAEAKNFMASINSRSSELLKYESENSNQVKVLKRGISFLDDDNVLLGPLCKIPKKIIIEEDKAVENVPFPQKKSYFHMSAPEVVDLEEDDVENAPCPIAILGGTITTNGMNETSTSETSSMTIIRSSNTTISCHNILPPQTKSYFHMSAPEVVDLEEDDVENAPCPIAILGGTITTNGMNETSTSETSSMTIIRSSNTTISCHNILPPQTKSYFHMSAPEDIDDSDEEYDVPEETDQSLFDLGTAMNDGSTSTCGSNNEGDFTFPVLIDLNDHFAPPSPTMPSPSYVQLPFQKES